MGNNNSTKCIAITKKGEGCKNEAKEILDVLSKNNKALWTSDISRSGENMPGWFLRRDAGFCSSHLPKVKRGIEIPVKWPAVQMPIIEDTSPPRMDSGVKCGNCTKQKLPNPYHATAEDVRACYGFKTKPEVKEKDYVVFDDKVQAIAQAKKWKTSMVPRKGKFIVPKPKG